MRSVCAALLALMAAAPALAQTEGAPETDDVSDRLSQRSLCQSAVNAAMVGEWSAHRVWREGDAMHAGAATIDTSFSDGVYASRVQPEEAAGFIATWRPHGLISDDVVSDLEGKVLVSARRTTQDCTALDDGWRTIAYTAQFEINGTAYEMTSFMEIGPNAYVTINALAEAGQRPRWHETITAQRR